MMDKNTNLPPIVDIGEALSQARQAQGISLATAAMQTNLSQDILTKLENNQFNEIAAPVFARGYLNIYARFLGLDDTQFSQAFNEIGQKDEGTLVITPTDMASQPRSFKRNHALRWLALAFIFVLVALILMQVINQNSWLMRQVKQAFPDNTQMSEGAGATRSNDIVLEINNEGQASVATNQNLPSLTSIEDIVEEERVALDDNQAIEEQTSELSLTSIEEAETTQEAQNLTQDEPVSVQNSVDEGIRTAQLKTSDENWIEIRDSQRRVIAARIFKAGESIVLSSEGAPYTLSAGRPNAIEFSIGGEVKTLENYKRAGTSRLYDLVIE